MPMTTRFALPCALLSLLPYAAAAQQSAQNPGTQNQNVLGFPAHNGPIEVVLNDQRAQTIFQTIVKMAGVNAIFDPAFDEAQSGALVSVHISAASLQDALDQAAAKTNAYWRPVGQNTISVTPFEPGKERAVLAAQPPPAVSSRMLVVGPPKIYDDLYLQGLLTSLRNQLANVNGVDQATLLSHIGMTQGMDLRQTSVAISASGPSTPATSTFTLPPGVPAFSPAAENPTATTPGTTTTAGSMTPAAPTPPAPTLAPPTVGQSSLAAYNESLQLSSEILNTQLLLDGALSDRLQTDGKPKTTFTVGFPITVTPPSPDDRKLQNAAAEVEISFCPFSSQEAPDIVTLLPRERSYNVANLVDKSFLGSISGILGGVANIGGSFLWSHKTYYLVQQQETVALLRPPGACQGNRNAVTFAWQINPVLGKTFVRPGTSMNFVQISIPEVVQNTLASQRIGEACVTVRWRTGDKKGNYLGAGIDPDQTACYPINYYTTTQASQEVTVTDAGQGNVHVNVTGTFLPGTTVRVGNNFFNPLTVTTTHDALTFTVSAKTLAAAGRAYVVGRDSREREIVEHLAKFPSSPLKIGQVRIEPYSDSHSRVTIDFTPPGGEASVPADPAFYPWVVVIGDKVFGLSDARFLMQGDKSIKLIAPTDLLRSSQSIQMRRLLWQDSYFRDDYPIVDRGYPKSNPSVSKTSIISTQKGLTLALTGSGMDDLKLISPDCSGCKALSTGSTLARVLIPKPEPPKKAGLAKDGSSVPRKEEPKDETPAPPDPTDGLKQIILCRGKHETPVVGKPFLGEQPKECDDSYPVLVLDVPKVDAPAPKPGLDKHTPVIAGTSPITITGTLLEQVVLIEDGKQSLRFRLSADKTSSLILELPNTISKTLGGHTLLVTFADKTTATYLVTIKGAEN